MTAKAGSDLQSEFTGSRADNTRGFSVDPTPQQLKAVAQQHKQSLELEERRHRLEQASKDNDLRRLAFQVVLGAVLAVLVVAFYLAIESKNGTTRAWSQGLISTLMGAIGGGVLGYFTGKSSK